MSNPYAILLSIPALRAQDLAHMPNLSGIASRGGTRTLAATFPCVTCVAQACLTTGAKPESHGVLANGFFWREKSEVEMWTAWNDAVLAPQIWSKLREHDSSLTSAAWFPLLVKGADADFICTPAPIHNPDGTESLWCYTKPTELYGELRDALGHFPLMNFWGPLANVKSNEWIASSLLMAAKKFQPRFIYAYLPHTDNVAQKFGPDSPQMQQALTEIDALIGKLRDGLAEAGLGDALWVVASEYVITPVTGASFPNRRLREAGFLGLIEQDGRELLDVATSRAWALVDHQLAHVFVRNPADIAAVAELFRNDPAVAEALVGEDRARRGVDHPRAGEVVLISQPDQWFAYYWWLDDAKAPPFARTVDIHQKPGYDPAELFIEMPAKTIPLDASLVKGSHGYPADAPERQGVLICSDAGALPQKETVADVDVAGIILRNFGAPAS